MVAELVSVAPDGSGQQVGYIPVERVRNDMPQVRRDWRHDEGNERLEELTQSIRNHGLLQPVEVVLDEDGYYQVVVGYRRYAAAKRAGLRHLPAIVREASDEERTALQLVENVHRQHLAPMDEAEGYAVLLEQRGGSVKGLARSLGIPSSRVANLLRVRDDAVLSAAVKSGRIGREVAAKLSYVGGEYARPLYESLRQGGSVSLREVRQLSECKRQDGVYDEQRRAVIEKQDAVLRLRETGMSISAIAAHLVLSVDATQHLFDRARERRPEWQDPNPGGSARQTRLRARIVLAHARRAQGESIADISTALGCHRASVLNYLRSDPAQQAPNVTFNGVSLDPIIATAHERQDDCENEDQPTPPHPRPLRSPLPWENQDESGVHYGVDPAGLVHPEPQPQHESPRQPSAPAASAVQPPEPLRRVQVPALMVDDPDVTRLRFMLQGAQQPCRELLGAMLNLGREKGWSCQDLWRKVQAASV